MTAVPPELAMNTAVSFATNTNWQNYAGETTLSYLTQMLGLTVQNFLSAATGMAILVAMIRGFVRRNSPTIGNFWCDLVRSTLYILMPLSIVVALALVSQGVVQTFESYRKVTLIEPGKDDRRQASDRTDDRRRAGGLADRHQATRHQRRRVFQRQFGPSAGGPHAAGKLRRIGVADRDFGCALLHLRQDGGRYAPRLGPAGRHARPVRSASCCWAIIRNNPGNPRLAALGVDQQPGPLQPGGNMEGKEVRNGIAQSSMWAAATTATSCGAVNSMHDSYTPLGGLVPLWLMHEGEVVFGGVGSGLYGMLAFAIIAVFIAGLMVGRTPEYLGKKIEAFEMKMAALVVLVMPMAVLIGTAVAVATDAGRAGIHNPGPHGFSEVLYAFTSAGNNNGSAFAGLDGDQHLLQFVPGHRHARGPLLAGHSDAGHRRLAGAEEDHARQRRHVAHPHAAVCRVPGRDSALGRRIDVHSGVGPGADRRAVDDGEIGYGVSSEVPLVVRSRDCAPGGGRFLVEVRSAAAGAQPGDVHGIRRQHPDNGVVPPLRSRHTPCAVHRRRRRHSPSAVRRNRDDVATIASTRLSTKPADGTRSVPATFQRRAAVVHSGRFGVAMVHGVVRQFRRGDGRRPRQGPSRRPPPRPPRGLGKEARQLLPSPDQPSVGARRGAGGEGCGRVGKCELRIANCKLQIVCS